MSTVTTYQGRWGFYPCDYARFLKLKRLHKWYWQTVYDFHRWHRWQRKEPQNRQGPEPACCHLFVLDKGWIKPVQIHGEPGFKIYPKTVVDHGLAGLYQMARMPRTEAEAVTPFDAATVERIDSLYQQAQAYFQE